MAATRMQASASPTAVAVLLPVTGAAAAPVSCPAVVNIIGRLSDEVPDEERTFSFVLHSSVDYTYTNSIKYTDLFNAIIFRK